MRTYLNHQIAFFQKAVGCFEIIFMKIYISLKYE